MKRKKCLPNDIRRRIHLCLTAGCEHGCLIGGRQSEVDLFSQALPHLLEPCSRIRAVDDAPQESQPFADVVTIAPDIFLGNLGVQGEEAFHASGFGKDVGCIA
jgi:hypothetical protein